MKKKETWSVIRLRPNLIYIYTGPLYIFFVFPVNSLAAILDRI